MIKQPNPDNIQNYLEAYYKELVEGCDDALSYQRTWGRYPGFRVEISQEAVIDAFTKRGWGIWKPELTPLPHGQTVLVHKQRRYPIALQSEIFPGAQRVAKTACAITFCGIELPVWDDIMPYLNFYKYGRRTLEMGTLGFIFSYSRDQDAPVFHPDLGMVSVFKDTVMRRTFYRSKKFGCVARVNDAAGPTDVWISFNPSDDMFKGLKK